MPNQITTTISNNCPIPQVSVENMHQIDGSMQKAHG
jgi:hypothetical protein